MWQRRSEEKDDDGDLITLLPWYPMLIWETLTKHAALPLRAHSSVFILVIGVSNHWIRRSSCLFILFQDASKRTWIVLVRSKGFPGGSEGKASACNAGDLV